MNLSLINQKIQCFYNDIKKSQISIEEVKNLEQDYEKYLKEIRKGNKSAE